MNEIYYEISKNNKISYNGNILKYYYNKMSIIVFNIRH